MNIVIVDDDQLVSLSLKTILEANGDIYVSAVGRDGKEAVRLYEKHQPDVLLMDIRMEGMTGLEAARSILLAHPDARVLLLTTFSDDEYIVKAIQYGAKGYILKQEFESIAPALFSVYNGQTVFGNEIVEKLPGLLNRGNQDKEAEEFQKTCERMRLSEKEIEIIRLVADGLNNKEISERLFLGEGTVRNYISLILEKLGLRDRTQLACFYYRGGQGLQ